jgi:hypothetical protein
MWYVTHVSYVHVLTCSTQHMHLQVALHINRQGHFLEIFSWVSAHYLEARKLWFGHVMRMPEERWLAIIHSWIPPGRWKMGQHRRSWWDSITEAIKKEGWGKKTPRTGYFGREDWEGGRQPYKPIHIYLHVSECVTLSHLFYIANLLSCNTSFEQFTCEHTYSGRSLIVPSLTRSLHKRPFSISLDISFSSTSDRIWIASNWV